MSNTNHQRGRRRRGVRMAGLLAAGASLLGVGIGATPAQAADTTASFYVYPYISNIDCFYMSGVISMSQYDAQGYLNNGAYFYAEMWGDDPIYDDHIVSSQVVYQNTNLDPRFYATARGIEFDWYGCLYHSQLNEDWGGDEIYVTVVAIDGAGHALADYVETNRVHRSY